MKSFTTLVQEAWNPPRRVYYDNQGNYRGSSVDISPIITFVGWIYARLYLAYICLTPLLAPLYMWAAFAFTESRDAEFSKKFPKEWAKYKYRIRLKYTIIFWGWVAYWAYYFIAG